MIRYLFATHEINNHMRVSFSIQRAFGSYIAELRNRAGLQVKQLAERSGLSGDHLARIERGEVNLNLGTMLILAMSLDTTPQELFRGIAGRIGGGQEPRFTCHSEPPLLRDETAPLVSEATIR